MSNVASGWYPDPLDPQSERFWDGSVWTEQVRNPPASSLINSSQDWSDLTPVNAAPAYSYQPPAQQQNFINSNFLSSDSIESDLAPRTVSMVEAITRAFKKYAHFNGRASRSELWWFQLFYWLVTYAGQVVATLAFGIETLSSLLVISLIDLVLIIPLIAVLARRMHDTDHSGWWQLVLFVNLYFAVIKGTNGPNKYDSVLGPRTDDPPDH